MNLKSKLLYIWRNHYILILLIGIFILGITMISSLSSALREQRNENKILQNNITALQDSVRVTYNKWKEAEYNKQSFVVSDPEELRLLAADLYQEIQKMKDDVKSINRVVAKLEDRDTVPLYVSNPSPNKYNFLFDTTFSKGNRQVFGGFINTNDPDSSRITRRELEMSLYTGLKNVNGKPTIYARTDFPGITFDLIGSEIDPNYFTKPSKEKLINYATLNIGQNVLSYNYGGANRGKVEIFQPRVDASLGVGLNIKKLLSRK